MVKKTCRVCGKKFEVRYQSSKRKNCSAKCRGVKTKPRADTGLRRVEWVEVSCAGCGVVVEVSPHRVRFNERRGWKHYCSTQCKDANQEAGGRPPKDGIGAKWINSEGYVRIYVAPDKRPAGFKKSSMLEHRVVMAEKLGRSLLPSETVHHINGDKTDNRPTNLQLRTGRHGKGGCFRCRACGSTDIDALGLKEI